MSRSVKSWCFTVNFAEEDVPEEPATAIPWNPERLQCLIYQLERGTSGTVHFQGYVECKCYGND